MKKFVVVESFDCVEKTVVEANTAEEARDKIWNDEEHTGEIIDVYEQK